MTTIYFVRHATPDLRDKSENRVLSKKGINDSLKVFDYLLDKNIDEFYSSPYARSIQTIKPLADNLNKDIKEVFELRERSVGAWINDFDDYSFKQWNDFNYKITNGESLSEVQERNINAINKIIDDNKNKTICIGTHGTSLSLIINYYYKNFSYNDFNRIKNLMPWIVKMTFNNNNFLTFEEISV